MTKTLWVTDASCGGPNLIVLEEVTIVGRDSGNRWYVFVGRGASVYIDDADAQRIVEALGGGWADREAKP